MHDHSSRAQSHRETTQINGVRDYLPGDTFSRIHWNATARTGSWKSKEFEREAMPKLFVLFDREKASYASDELFELAVAGVASILQFGAKRTLPQGLLSPGSEIQLFPAGRGTLHAAGMLNHLVDAGCNSRFPIDRLMLEPQAEIGKGSMLVIVSPRTDDALLGAFRHLCRQHQVLFHIRPAVKNRASVGDWNKALRSIGAVGVSYTELNELPVELGG